MPAIITDELIGQYLRMWRSLREAIANTPQGEWQTGSDDYAIPARLAYHVLHAADLYSTTMGYEEYKPHRGYKLDWERTNPADLPAREAMMACVDTTEGKVKAWLEHLCDEGLLKEQSDYHWTGKTALGRAIYVLQHCQVHIGEINAELRRRGIEGGRW